MKNLLHVKYWIVALSPLFLFHYQTAFGQDAGYIPYRKSQLWGYCTPKKKVVIEPKYLQASRFDNGVAVVQGENGLFLLINDRGVEISKPYDRIDSFQDGMARVVSNGWLGFINRTGKEVVPLAYEDEVESVFKDGMAKVSKSLHDGKKWGFINKEGEEVVPISYEYVDDFYSGMAMYEDPGNGFGFINRKGEKVIPADPNNKITQAVNFGNSDRTLIKRNGVVLLIDKKGTVIKKYRYDEIGWRYEKVIMVGQEGKWGFIDYDGKTVAPLMYDEDEWGDMPFRKGLGLGVVSINGKWGVINQQNQPIVPFMYEGLDVYPNSLVRAWRVNELEEYEYGVFSLDGEVLPLEYRRIKVCDNGYIFAANDYQWMLYNQKGDQVSDKEYYSVGSFSEGLAAVTVALNGKFGYIDTQGNEVVPHKYNLATSFKDGIALVVYQGREGYINKKGEEFWD